MAQAPEEGPQSAEKAAFSLERGERNRRLIRFSGRKNGGIDPVDTPKPLERGYKNYYFVI
jgi:hypothetical protein